MLTLLSYIALKYFFVDDWNGLILFLPICLDCVILDKIDEWRNK